MRTVFFYTVLFDKPGYPVTYIDPQTLRVKQFGGTFGDPGEASREFQACIGGEQSWYLEPVRFLAQVSLREHPITYVHPDYPSVLEVYVSETIRTLYPESPVAGRYVRACVGHYYLLVEKFEGENHKTHVPCFYDGNIYYVPEDFVWSLG